MIRVVVVDGFSSGRLLAKKLQADGCHLCHVASSPALDDYYYVGFEFCVYETFFTHSDMAVTRQKIKQFAPDFIVAGAESGVLLADQLNELFGLDYANDFFLEQGT